MRQLSGVKPWDKLDTRTSSNRKLCGKLLRREVAERLGVSSHSLYEWIRQYRPATGTKAYQLTNKDDEIRSLRAELKRVTEERTILRKAAAYFAKASG